MCQRVVAKQHVCVEVKGKQCRMKVAAKVTYLPSILLCMLCMCIENLVPTCMCIESV